MGYGLWAPSSSPLPLPSSSLSLRRLLGASGFLAALQSSRSRRVLGGSRGGRVLQVQVPSLSRRGKTIELFIELMMTMIMVMMMTMMMLVMAMKRRQHVMMI